MQKGVGVSEERVEGAFGRYSVLAVGGNWSKWADGGGDTWEVLADCSEVVLADLF